MSNHGQELNVRFINGLSEGSTEVLSAIYKTCFPMISKYVLRGGGKKEDAEDIFQDGLVVVYRQVKAEKLQLTCAFSTYLFGVCKRVWLKKQSRTKPVENLEQSQIENEEVVDFLIEKTERYSLYQEKFKLLDKDSQKVLDLFLSGKSMKEIAREMGYASEGYAKKRKFNCKKKLIQLIRRDSRFNELK